MEEFGRGIGIGNLDYADSDGVGGLEDFKLEEFGPGRGIGIGNLDYSLRAGKLPALRAGSMPALRSTRVLENVEDV